MATFGSFEEIDAWKLSRIYCNRIFKLSSHGEFSQDFALKNQVRRSSGSVMDNIAEGYGREGNKEFVQYLYYSIGSLDESKSQLYRACDQDYISTAEFDELSKNSIVIRNKLKALANYLKKTEIKGLKFKAETKKL